MRTSNSFQEGWWGGVLWAVVGTCWGVVGGLWEWGLWVDRCFESGEEGLQLVRGIVWEVEWVMLCGALLK